MLSEIYLVPITMCVHIYIYIYSLLLGFFFLVIADQNSFCCEITIDTILLVCARFSGNITISSKTRACRESLHLGCWSGFGTHSKYHHILPICIKQNKIYISNNISWSIHLLIGLYASLSPRHIRGIVKYHFLWWTMTYSPWSLMVAVCWLIRVTLL